MHVKLPSAAFLQACDTVVPGLAGQAWCCKVGAGLWGNSTVFCLSSCTLACFTDVLLHDEVP